MSQDLPCRYAGQTVLAVGAHPDDVELGMGGTVARLRRGGARVVIMAASCPSDYERRTGEAREAAQILGAEFRLLINHGPQRLEDVKSYELVKRMDEIVKEYQPAAMFTHGPADFHRDHLLTYEAAMSAQRVRFLDFFCYYPTSCRPAQVGFKPQVYVDITETMDLKMDAINAHSSQFSGRGLAADFHRDLARSYGRMLGTVYAEGLEVVRMKLV